MTKEPLTVAPGISVEDAMLLVTRYRCRHLPVVEKGRILGLVSIGDLTRWLVRDRENEIEDLMHYINGTYEPQARRDI
jgi:CBS domain-containing protein